MKFLSLQPFVPSGSDMEKSKQLFLALGFKIDWDQGDYVGFLSSGCGFILQKFNSKEFAENFMLSVRVDNIEEFRNNLLEQNLTEKFGISISKIITQPYGKEVNIIDLAGVCWHFIE
ncbi:hypothetical protein BH09BAC3_BH09BAC3_07990 [soil metagenome]